MMMTAGSWNIPELQAGMGDSVGVLIPPYSDTPIKSVSSTAGQGIVVTTYGQHKDEAGKFAAWILSDEGQTALGKLSAPTRPGFMASNNLINELAEKSSAEGVINVPMFDNFTQPGVTDALYRNVALVLINQMTPTDALAAVDAAFDALPPEQKQVHINLGQ
jgi:ABC-type glycerol-3-phosphate transport system substrate-binding protein